MSQNNNKSEEGVFDLDLEKTSNGVHFEDFIESVDGSTVILYPSEYHSKSDIDAAKKEIKNNLDVVKISIADGWDLDNLYKKAIFRDERTKPLKWYQIEQDEKLLRKERKKGTTPKEFVTEFVLPNTKRTERELKKKYGKSIYKMEKGGKIIEIDEHGSNIPKELDDLFSTLDEDADPYEEMERMRVEARDLGYDFDYGLDGSPTEFWKLDNSKKEKFYRGGELKHYNKWKSIDWNSFKYNDTKQRSNIYRLLGWYAADRINPEKLPKEKREEWTEWFVDDFYPKLLSDDTLNYIFHDRVEEAEKQFETLLEDKKLEGIEDIKKMDKEIDKLLKTKEYEDFKENLDSLGITWKDVEKLGADDILEKIYEDKDKQWVIDYFFLNDENWLDFDRVFGGATQELEEMYHSILDSGAVFTEEQEEQQFDMFEEPKEETPKKKEVKKEKTNNKKAKNKEETKDIVYVSFMNKDKGFKADKKYFGSYKEAENWAKKEFDRFNPDMINYDDNPEALELQKIQDNVGALSEQIDSELETLNELLDDAEEDKNKSLISELKDRIEFLEELKDDEKEVESFEKGGRLTDYDEIKAIFNIEYMPEKITIIALKDGKYVKEVGYTSAKLHFGTTNVLNLQKINMSPEFNNSEDMSKIIALIKNNLRKETGKDTLMINNVIQ